MVIALIGESCTGKSTIAAGLKERLGAEVYSGKDYLRLAKNEAEAKERFRALLAAAVEPGAAALIYVVSEKEHLPLLPEGAFRILVTAELPAIEERFARRMGGKLPPPVAAMLQKKHGMFDEEPNDVHIKSGMTDADAACSAILARLAPAQGCGS